MYLAHHELDSELTIIIIITIIINTVVVGAITKLACSASFTALMSSRRPSPAHTLPTQCEKHGYQS